MPAKPKDQMYDLNSAIRRRRFTDDLIAKSRFIFTQPPVLMFATGEIAFGSVDKLRKMIETATTAQELYEACDREDLLALTSLCDDARRAGGRRRQEIEYTFGSPAR